MKKVFVFGLAILVLISFVFAQGNQSINLSDQEQNGENNVQTSNQEKNQISTANQNQGELTQSQIKNIIQSKNRIRAQAQTGECPENCTCTGSAMKCKLADGSREMTVTAGESGNTIVQIQGTDMTTNVTLYHHNGKIYGEFKGNQTKEIKVMPDEVEEKIKEKLKTRLENQIIELDEDGVYQVQTQKRARLFYLFPVKEKVKAEVNSENGEIIKMRNSWWGFLAKDVEKEDTSEE
jgi:hypothetical protein